MAKAKESTASGVDAVEDDEAKEAKKEKEGVDEVENPNNTPGATILGINCWDGEKKKRRERWFTKLSVVSCRVAMLDATAAPKKEELGDGDRNDYQDCYVEDRHGQPPVVNDQFARLAKEERETIVTSAPTTMSIILVTIVTATTTTIMKTRDHPRPCSSISELRSLPPFAFTLIVRTWRGGEHLLE